MVKTETFVIDMLPQLKIIERKKENEESKKEERKLSKE